MGSLIGENKMRYMMNSAVCLLECAADHFPQNIAVQDENTSLSYAEYRCVSRTLGTALLRKGGPLPVLVYLPKTIPALTCFMGAMYSGDHCQHCSLYRGDQRRLGEKSGRL
jgi:non-ribosomal peptide synthetase component E (peptide arylation enzyme)